eukprot:6725945-Lingulodinium_polyedra.AAC.1
MHELLTRLETSDPALAQQTGPYHKVLAGNVNVVEAAPTPISDEPGPAALNGRLGPPPIAIDTPTGEADYPDSECEDTQMDDE